MSKSELPMVNIINTILSCMIRCPQCGEYSLVETGGGKFVCDNFFCGYEYQERETLWAPSPWDSKEYETRQIHPVGKNSTKYRWFICTPNFPSEQYKVNDPHCHCWPLSKKGEARISLNPLRLKVKWGKIPKHEQTEIEDLVEKNYSYIYEEWKKEWMR